MAVETTILPLIVKLKELGDTKEVINPRLGSRLKQSIDTLIDVQTSLEDEERDSLSLQLLQAVYRAEDIIDKEIRKEFQEQKVFIKVLRAGIHWRSVYFQTHIFDKIQKLVDDLKKKSVEMLKSSAPESPHGNVASDKKTGTLDLNEDVHEFAELITNGFSSPFRISVVDVVGSAKTSELWKIFDSEAVKNHFQCRAWVQVPQELAKRELIIDILKQVQGPEVEERLPNIESLQQEIYDFLILKRYLVVLIDVRTPDIWKILQFLFPNTLNGSRVILSFHEADAARHRHVKFYGGDLLLNPRRESLAIGENVARSNIPKPPSRVSDEQILDEETDIVGMEDEILKLARLILEGGNENFLISMVGAAGSGKTTLVKTIYNSSYTRQNFDCRAWVDVYVSHDYDMRNVMSGILEQMGGDKVEEELPLGELERKITRILDQKRCFIVLDDLHLPGAWYELKRIFSTNTTSSGSRVILITREAHVARSFGPSILHQIRPLNRDESRKLFLKKVGRENSTPELLENIWKICGGVPLAIYVLGGLLSTFDDSEWSQVIQKIMSGRKRKGREQAGSLDKMDTSSIWVLSYRYLSPHLRACLHYLCLFPKSYEIPVRRLHQLWLAERFVSPNEGEKMAPEDRIKKDFEQLELRNMIEVVKRRPDGMAKTCRAPSTLSDTFFQDAEKLGFSHIYHNRRSDSTSKSPDRVRRLAEHLDKQNNIPSAKQFKYLHSYISFDNRKGDKPADEVGDLLNKTTAKKGYGLLRVLDLEGVYKPVLPETIGNLRLLRYVGLRWTFLDSIPESVGDLLCLETLDLKHTNISTLPKSIWKVKTLRHLYMNNILFQFQKPLFKPSLANLQTLWGLLIGSKGPPAYWLSLARLNGLRKLGLTCHTASLGEINKWIVGLRSLESLRLRSINDFGEHSDLDFPYLGDHKKLTELYLLGKLSGPIHKSQLPPNLRIFTLSLSYLAEDPMPVLQQMKDLKILRLFAHSYMGEEMTCHSGGFPKLRVLKLWVLKELKMWTIEDKAMPELRELEIRCCKKLKKPIGLDKVATLKELTLTDMKEDFEAEVRGSMVKSVNIVTNPLRLRPYNQLIPTQMEKGRTFAVQLENFILPSRVYEADITLQDNDAVSDTKPEDRADTRNPVQPFLDVHGLNTLPADGNQPNRDSTKSSHEQRMKAMYDEIIEQYEMLRMNMHGEFKRQDAIIVSKIGKFRQEVSGFMKSSAATTNVEPSLDKDVDADANTYGHISELDKVIVSEDHSVRLITKAPRDMDGQPYKEDVKLSSLFTNALPRKHRTEEELDEKPEVEATEMDIKAMLPIDLKLVAEFEEWMRNGQGIISLSGIDAQPSWFKTIINGDWLDGNHINEYLRMIREHQQKNPEAIPQRCTSTDAYFFSYIVEAWKKQMHDNVSTRWIDNVIDYVDGRRLPSSKIWSDVDMVYIPINVTQAHWIAAQVDLVAKRITLFDSFISSTKDNFMCMYIEGLSTLLPTLLQQSGFYDKRSDLTMDMAPFEVLRQNQGVPQQDSKSGDCGIFVVMIIKYLVMNHPFDFGPENGPFLRQKMAIELWRNELL